jgi:Baseplate J-like protein
MADEPTPTPDAAAASTLVYLDVDDEITSAAARIRGAAADRVALVLPYGSRLATSRINFRLLAREATERGKHIEIICADASARALALAAGLPVHPSVASFEGRAPVAKGSGGAGGAGGAGDEIGGDAAAAAIGGATADDADPADDTQTRVLAVPRRSSPRVPIVGPPRPPMRPRIAAALGVAVVALVLVAGVLAVEVLPSATIVLHPRSEAIGPLDFTVEARSDVATADSEALVIPAQRVPFSLEATDTFTATGVKVIESKATGNVRFSNFDNGRGVAIPAGTIVRTEDKIEFVTLADLTLPRAQTDFFPPFTTRPSTGSVGVEAAAAGDGGNVGNNTIVQIPKGGRNLFVTNPEPTTGGEHRQATEVSATDVETAKAAIGTALADQLNQQLAAGTGVPPELTMFPATSTVGEPEYAVDPASLVGTEATEFDLSATAEGAVVGVDPTPIGAIAESRLESQVKPAWTLVATATTPTIGTPSAFGEIVTYPVTITGAQVHDVDRAALLAAIKGLGLADARARLDAFGDVEITLWPDWVSKVPTNPDRITFTLGDPQPSATP